MAIKISPNMKVKVSRAIDIHSDFSCRENASALNPAVWMKTAKALSVPLLS